MMQRFWSRLAVELGKRAGLVSVVGLLVTVALGFGITKLDFATGQDSYLEKDSEVYEDNVAYQDLFGGQAMLGVVTMDEGHSVVELFDDAGRAQFDALHQELTDSGRYVAVVTPMQALQFTDNLVQGGVPGGDPLASVAGQVLQRALGVETPGSPEAAVRQEQSLATLGRINAIPAEQRTMANPAWVDFLLHDNFGNIRTSLLPFFADDQHASILVRLQGNQSIEVEGEDATVAQTAMRALEFENASVVATGAPILLKDINDYLRGGMLLLGGIAVAIMVLSVIAMAVASLS